MRRKDLKMIIILLLFGIAVVGVAFLYGRAMAKQILTEEETQEILM